MQLIRQPPNSNLCLACCVAMISDTTLDDVLSKCKLSFRYPEKQAHLKSRGDFLPLIEAIKYLINRELSYGICFGWPNDPQRIHPDRANAGITVNCDLSTANAIVTVQSLTLGPDAMHCVVYNKQSKTMFDPQEHLEQDVSKYAILEWASVIPVGD